MHECLQTAEIQRLVFQELGDDRETTLYAIAQTCRAFKEVALACLWENLTSLYPLVCNLPEDILDNSPDDYGDRRPAVRFRHLLLQLMQFTQRNSRQTFKRGLEPKDWEIYHKYSCRVRSLNICAELGVDEQILQALCLYRPTQNLLPRLHTLFIDFLPENEHFAKYIQAFLSADIKHFTINAFCHHDDLPSDLLSLGRLCPSLTSLTVDWEELCRNYDPEYEEEVALSSLYLKVLPPLIRDLKTLKVITLKPSPLTPETLHYLSKLESLKELGIKLWWEESPLPNNQSYQLSRLTSLDISAATWRSLSVMVGSAINSPLKQIYVHIVENSHSTEQIPATIADVLNQLAQIPSLEDINIRELSRLSLPNDMDGKVGLLLGQLQNVKTFSFVCYGASLLGNEWLDMISSWSHLSVLRVYAQGYDEHPKMTLHGLLPVLTNCTRLHTLQVAVQCRGFELEQLKNSKLAPIRLVNLVHSPILDSTKNILSCLVNMFPTAQSISGSHSATSDLWNAINQVFIAHGRCAPLTLASV